MQRLSAEAKATSVLVLGLLTRGIACAILLLGCIFLSIGYANAQQPSGQPNTADDLSFWEELAFWEAVKDSANPAELETYVKAYPNGRFTALAKVRIASLKSKQASDNAATTESPPATPAPEPEPEPLPPEQTESPATAADTDTSTEPITPSAPIRASSYTAQGNSNIRAAPSTRADKIGLVRQNESILVLGDAANGAWYRVQTDDGLVGYVFAELLQPDTTNPAATTAGDTQQAAGSIEPGDVFRDCPECPALVVIPAGQFTMGSTERPDEQPVRTVSVPKPFALGVFELTVGAWQACVDDGGCRYQPQSPVTDLRLPMSNLSWDDAQEYITWLTAKTGQRYRLPSEAEWEYAARAGTTSRYWWGDQIGTNQANCQGCGSRWDNQQPAPVGSFKANPFGLYDMHGNLWEWTADCWNNSYSDAPSDTSVRTSGDCLARTLRGGAWKQSLEYARAARRSKYDRDVRYFLNGFRIARDL